MPKVYLSPAYHYWNPCAVAGCDETTHNNLYLDVLEPYLAACGIQYKRGPRRTPKSGEDGDALMLQAVRESDAWGADVHYVSHTNAANGGVRGYRPMIYLGSGGGRKLAACILKYRRKIYDQPIRLSESSVWYELRAPAAVSFYEEHVFHATPPTPSGSTAIWAPLQRLPAGDCASISVSRTGRRGRPSRLLRRPSGRRNR